MTNGTVKSSHLRLASVYLEKYIGSGFYLLDYRKCEISWCLCNLSKLPVMCINFHFNTYKLIRMCSFSTTAVERIWGLGDFVFNCISQHHLREGVRKQNVNGVC